MSFLPFKTGLFQHKGGNTTYLYIKVLLTDNEMRLHSQASENVEYIEILNQLQWHGTMMTCILAAWKLSSNFYKIIYINCMAMWTFMDSSILKLSP